MALENNKKLITAARLNKVEGEVGYIFLATDIVRMNGSLDFSEKPVYHTALFEAAWKNHEHIAKFLIDKGAGLNTGDVEGRSPLHEAAYYGHKNIIELLIDRGANINIQDDYGQTPLMRAIMGNRVDCVEFLVLKGADTNIIDKDNCTASHIAAFVGDPAMSKWLLYKGAVKNQYDVDWQGELEAEESWDEYTPVEPARKIPDPENPKKFQPGQNANLDIHLLKVNGIKEGAGDPYVIVSFEADGQFFSWKSAKNTDKHTPKWDEKYSFELKGLQALPEKFHVEVWNDGEHPGEQDKDRIATFAGAAEGKASTGDETLGYRDFPFPDSHDEENESPSVHMKNHGRDHSYTAPKELHFSYKFSILDA